MNAQKFFPCLQWMRQYRRQWLISDLIAAVIVTIMLVPQSLAYALLAGLPAEVGLYASILPLVLYAIFGTSRTLSVGPVAVISLMTAAAIQTLDLQSPEQYRQAAVVLALLSGIILLLLGAFRFGFLANFLSHPVVAGFITASAILIALSQLKHILGIQAEGDNLPHLLGSLWQHLSEINLTTLIVGTSCLLTLYLSRHFLVPLLVAIKVPEGHAALASRSMPMLVVVVSIVAAYRLDLGSRGLALVGTIPAGLPSFYWPAFDLSMWGKLLLSAVLISIIGYVESVSVGKTLALKKRQKIDQDQELIGLGLANCASAFSGGFPVTGGFSRSVVNYDAGAQTQAASVFAAIGIALVTLTLTGALAWLPQATLAATIIIAVLSLVDLSTLKATWHYSRSDFSAISLTIGITLLFGVELGVLCGVMTSIVLHLIKTSKPHIAVVGNVEGTEHYRNVKRHNVKVYPWILSLRVDQSLYFANASFLEDKILESIADRKQLKHIVLQCSAVNEIDLSAVEVLGNLNEQLRELAIGFHLSEVKGPVMDALRRSHFLQELNGRVFMTHHQAVEFLVEQEAQLPESKPVAGKGTES